MKRIFTTLVALTFVATSFAQVKQMGDKQTPVRDVDYQIKNESVYFKHSSQKGPAPYWFNYIGAAMDFYSKDPITADGFGPSLLFDGNAKMAASGAVQFLNVGQVFHFNNNRYDFWGDMLALEMGSPSIAHLPEGKTLSIDSLELAFLYKRGTNVAANVVDTLLISWGVDCDNDATWSLGSATSTTMNLYAPLFDANTYGFGDAAAENAREGVANPASTKTVYSQKIPLTIDDTTATATGFYFITMPADSRLQGITGKAIMTGFTFIPGNEIAGRDTNNTQLGVHLNNFRTIMYDDWRSAYTTPGSDLLKTDMNTSIHIARDNYWDPTSSWYHEWSPNIFWEGHPRPWISLKISCPDCLGVSINDPEVNKTISVYPNPVRDNLTIELVDDSKAQIELYNLVGQVVMVEQTNAQKINLNVNNVKDGVYMLKVTQNGTVYTSKVIVR